MSTLDFADLSKQVKEAEELYNKEASDFWNNLSYDDKLAAFYSVVSRLTQGELKEHRSYRGLLYDTFEFDMDSYGIGMQCGFMELHNAIYNKDELEIIAKNLFLDWYEYKKNNDYESYQIKESVQQLQQITKDIFGFSKSNPNAEIV